MAQTTNDPKLLHQISAGVNGRKRGHSYESLLANKLNLLGMPFAKTHTNQRYVEKGAPELILLNKILNYLEWEYCTSVKAYCTGRLATAEDGEKVVLIDGTPITECKSDIVIRLESGEKSVRIIGVSVKQCNTKKPTNAQVFFTTATAFYELIVNNGFKLSDNALVAMKQFCGDSGYTPLDSGNCAGRLCNPHRYFWEEICKEGKYEWERLFEDHQDEITKLLLQKGYRKNPFPPEIILHKTIRSATEDEEVAIFSMEEFISLSHQYSPFTLSKYRVRKGSYKEPIGIEHEAPRFGIIQMQRGGQKQHPSQLQFNLKAGYFYHPPFSDEINKR